MDGNGGSVLHYSTSFSPLYPPLSASLSLSSYYRGPGKVRVKFILLGDTGTCIAQVCTRQRAGQDSNPRPAGPYWGPGLFSSLEAHSTARPNRQRPADHHRVTRRSGGALLMSLCPFHDLFYAFEWNSSAKKWKQNLNNIRSDQKEILVQPHILSWYWTQTHLLSTTGE